MRPRVVDVTPGVSFGNFRQAVHTVRKRQFEPLQEDHIESREEGDDAVADVEVVHDLSSLLRPLHISFQNRCSPCPHVNPSAFSILRAATGCVGPTEEKKTIVFPCYCGDNFITPDSYAKHVAMHADGEWRPEHDEEDEGSGCNTDVYLEKFVKENLKVGEELTRDVRGGAFSSGARQINHVDMKALSIASSDTGSFFTAHSHQGSL